MRIQKKSILKNTSLECKHKPLVSVFQNHFKDDLKLGLDRTNWKIGLKEINLLMLELAIKNVAISLMFKMLDKRGSSDLQERRKLIMKYIERFDKQSINFLLADREFVASK